jgi:hypothetical protein
MKNTRIIIFITIKIITMITKTLATFRTGGTATGKLFLRRWCSFLRFL